MYNHQDLWPVLQADVLRNHYAGLMKQYEQALLMQVEGVFEVTIRSQSGALTIALDGMDASQAVIEALSTKLSDVESRIERHAIQTGENLASEKEEERAKWEARERERATERQAYIKQQQQLAQQATPTFNTKAPRPAKRTAQAQPHVMTAVGQMAAEAPMNSGSTAHAAARATNLPSA